MFLCVRGGCVSPPPLPGCVRLWSRPKWAGPGGASRRCCPQQPTPAPRTRPPTTWLTARKRPARPTTCKTKHQTAPSRQGMEPGVVWTIWNLSSYCPWLLSLHFNTDHCYCPPTLTTTCYTTVHYSIPHILYVTCYGKVCAVILCHILYHRVCLESVVGLVCLRGRSSLGTPCQTRSIKSRKVIKCKFDHFLNFLNFHHLISDGESARAGSLFTLS